jgi:hypothetical protein
MGLDSPTLPTSIVFQTSPRGIKGIADSDVEIFINCMMVSSDTGFTSPSLGYSPPYLPRHR